MIIISLKQFEQSTHHFVLVRVYSDSLDVYSLHKKMAKPHSIHYCMVIETNIFKG